MINEEELVKMMKAPESFRLEKTRSTKDTDKFCQAICAFANDLPDKQEKGYLLIGVEDDGSQTEKMLITFSQAHMCNSSNSPV